MRERGFIELTVIIYALVFVAIAGTVMYLVHLGGAHEREKQTKVTMAAKLDRQIDISNLGVALAQSDTKLATDSAQHTTDLKQKEATYAPNLHNYIPKSSLGKSCISAGFVRYTDSAAAGVSLPAGPPAAPASPAGAAGDVNAPAAAVDAAVDADEEGAVIARNYWRYHVCEQRVDDLTKYIDGTRSTFNDTVAKINASVKK